MRQKKYKVTLLCEVKCDCKAYDEINAELQAIENHPHLRVVKVRVQRRGIDTGFYTPFNHK
jgi:hypothetical protein